jgi:hypothetical protein
MANQKKGTLQQLQQVHRLMLAGQLIFIGIVAWLVYTGRVTTSSSLDRPLQLLCLVLAAAGFLGGNWQMKQQLKKVTATDTLTARATTYKQACLQQWAMLQAPSMMCTVSFLLTGNVAFLFLAATLVFLFTQAAPHRLKVMLFLNVREEELERF